MRQDRDKTGRHLGLTLSQDIGKTGLRSDSDLMKQDGDMTGHQSDLPVRQYVDKTVPRSDCDLASEQRQDKAPIRSRFEAVHRQDRTPFSQ